jgi:hypothetical protein
MKIKLHDITIIAAIVFTILRLLEVFAVSWWIIGLLVLWPLIYVILVFGIILFIFILILPIIVISAIAEVIWSK